MPSTFHGDIELRWSESEYARLLRVLGRRRERISTGMCAVPNCKGRLYRRSYCRRHYNEFLYGRSYREKTPQKGKTCGWPSCTEPSWSKGLCRKHNKKMWRLRGKPW